MSHRYDLTSQERTNGGPHSRPGARGVLRAAFVVLVYVALYLALHWLSVAFRTGPYKISPFYPSHGLSLALLLLFGLRYAPALVLGPVIIYLSSRQGGDLNWYMVLVPLIVAAGYGLAALVLKRVLRIDPYLRRLRDVNWFALVSVLASGVVASLTGLAFLKADIHPWPGYGPFVAIWWVGDAVGIATLAPFLLITVAPWLKEFRGRKPEAEIEPGRSSGRRNWSILELAAQVASILLVLWFVFGWRAATDSHRYYICFLPLIWIVLRHDRRGASLAVLVINLGVLFAVRGLQLEFVEMANILLFLEVLSISGLVLGSVVYERRQAERALRRGEERYRAYIQQRSEGIARFENERPVLIDLPEDEQIQLLLRNSYLAECNNVQAKMYGFAGPEEMLGFRLTDSMDRSKPQNIDNLRAFIRSGYRLEDVESQEFDRYGNTRYFLNSAIGIVENGALVRFWGTQLDITERKRAEEAQRASEERFSRVFNASPLPMTISTLKDGRIIDVNAAYLRASDFTREDVIGRTSAELNIWPASDDRLRFMDLLKGDGAISNVEVTFRGKKGNLRTTLLSADLIELDGEQCVLIVANDITRRKRAEEALRQSETRLASAQQLAHIGSWENDLATGKLYWSDETYRILGLDPGIPATSEMFWNAIHPDDKTALRRLMSETLLKGKVYSINHRVILPDGSERVVHAQGEAILDYDGLVVRLVGSAQDITERKRMEDALIESEARFRHVFESNMLGIGYSGTGGIITDANELLIEILGCSREDVSAGTVNWRDITPPEFADADQRAIGEMGSTGIVTPYEKEYFRPDGSRVPILIGAALLGGYTDRAVFFVLDITERKKAEEALRDSERRLRAVLEHLPAMVAALDETSAPVFWNRECERVTGYSPEEMLGNTKALKLLLPDQDYRKAVLAEHARRAGEYRDMETQIVCKDGSVRTLAWSTIAGRVGIAGWAHWGFGSDVTTRKQVDEALRKAEEKYRSIFENAVEGIYQSLPSGQFITANPALARILGYQSPADLIQELTELHDGQYVEPGRRVQFRRLLEEQASLVGFENQSYRKDGGKIWISENARAVRSNSGELLYYEGSMEDVTNRKRAEQRQAIQFAVTRVLAESPRLEDAIPELLQSICTEFEWETGLLWLVDPESLLLRFDAIWQSPPGGKDPREGFQQSTFSPGEGLAGNVLLSRAPVWNPDPVNSSASCEHRGATGLEGSFGFPIPVAGDVFGVMEFLSPEVRERDDDLLKIMADIGSRIGQFVERKRAEDEQTRLQSAITNAATEWQLTFDAIESPVLVLDLDGRVRRLNRAAQLLACNSDPNCVGSEVGQLQGGEPWQRIRESVEFVRTSRSAVSGQVVDLRNGTSWDIVASPFLAPGERDEWVIAVARDVSGMTELQESLRRSETMSAMGSLVAGVAHEVRNPLFGISATLDAFDARFGAREEFRQYTKVLRGELDRLSRLMQDLLDYGKPASLNLSEGRMEAVVSEALQICRPVAERSQVQIVSQLNSGLRPVRMDQRRLVQVFQNLLENAVHHSPAGGVVTVDAEMTILDEHDWIECSIKDSGKGFLNEDLPRLFEPFFTKRRGGTGLGLSIVQRIVEQHGGHVSAENRPEGGALILLTFPAQ